jgi:hypothetical protein
VIFAYRDPTVGRDASAGLVLTRAPWPPVIPVTNRENGWAQQSGVPVVSGRLYEARAWVKVVTAGVAELVCTLDSGEAFRLSSGGDWALYSGLVVSDGTGLFRLDVEGAGGNATFHVDDCALEEVPVASGMHYAYKALYERLKTINGAAGGYHHDLSDGATRVLSRDHPPGTNAPARPYICLPVEDDGPIGENEDSVRVTLHQPIVIYPREKIGPIQDPIDSSGAVDVLKWQDDIMRCLMPPSDAPVWNLGEGRIEELGFVSKRAFSEKHEGMAPFIEIVVSLTMTLTREELGPE